MLYKIHASNLCQQRRGSALKIDQCYDNRLFSLVFADLKEINFLILFPAWSWSFEPTQQNFRVVKRVSFHRVSHYLSTLMGNVCVIWGQNPPEQRHRMGVQTEPQLARSCRHDGAAARSRGRSWITALIILSVTPGAVLVSLGRYPKHTTTTAGAQNKTRPAHTGSWALCTNGIQPPPYINIYMMRCCCSRRYTATILLNW